MANTTSTTQNVASDHRIMVVDDSSSVRIALHDILMGGGIAKTVVEAPDGQTALAVHSRLPCDLIILDWKMPGMDGLMVLLALRKTDRKTPVIVLTSEKSIEQVKHAMAAGANDYLIKPCGSAELIQRVGRLLEPAVEIQIAS